MNTPALSVRDLGVTVNGQSILSQVDLDVASGEFVGLIGPNGAGKTTLLRALAGLVEHDGTVRVHDGQAPSAVDVALVPQIPILPPGMTVSEYVLLGRTPHLGWLARESRRDLRIVDDVLVRLDLRGFAGRAMTSLSGGEAQRAVIARALAQQAPLLLLDEPTSALDLGHQHSVLELVDGLRRRDGLTVIAAMHDLTMAARFADTVVLLDHGRVVQHGAPSAVLDARRLSRVYRTPLTVRVIDGDLIVLPAPRSDHDSEENAS